MSDPPPTYNESLQQSRQSYGASMHSSYGTVGPGPAGAYPGYQNYPAPGQGYGPAPPFPKQPPQPYGGYPLSQPGYQNSVASDVVVSQYPTQSVVLVGGCPACRVGVLEDDFTCMGVMCAILCFPVGILCCLAMRQRRCAHCGAVFA